MTAPVIPISGSLVSITDHLEALFNSVEMTEEGSEERAQIEREIEAYIEAEVRKVDSVAGYIAHCESQQDFAAAEMKRLQERKASWARKQEKLEQYIRRAMLLAGREKLEGRTNTLILKSCPPSVEVTDQSLVPEEYIRVTVMESIDKTAAKAALKSGEVPGLKLVSKQTVIRK